jgi:enoyl-CoA hydratase
MANNGATEAVRIETNGPVWTITLDRADVKNAVDYPTAQALAEAFIAFDEDENARVAVLHGANDTFCAGADLKALSETPPKRANKVRPPVVGDEFDPLTRDGPMGPSRMVLSKPVIAAISGYAVAGGIELALWCDMRVVEEDAIMGVFCRRWGVPLIDGGTIRLPRLIGHARAMDLILTGRPVNAEEALQMGLANRIAPKGEALQMAEQIAHDIARFPQICMRNDRMSAIEQWDLPYDEAIEREYLLGKEVLDAGEAVRGATRFASGKGRGGNFDDI